MEALVAYLDFVDCREELVGIDVLWEPLEELQNSFHFRRSWSRARRTSTYRPNSCGTSTPGAGAAAAKPRLALGKVASGATIGVAGFGGQPSQRGGQQSHRSGPPSNRGPPSKRGAAEPGSARVRGRNAVEDQ